MRVAGVQHDAEFSYGCMTLTCDTVLPSDEEALEALKWVQSVLTRLHALTTRTAADAGATAWSSAFFYGNPGHRMDNIYLLGRFFKKVGRWVCAQARGAEDSIPSTRTRSFW